MTDFKVMTWNLENLFPAEHYYGPDTQDEYMGKLEALVSTIKRIDADVVAVQEVGDIESFNDLFNGISEKYHHSMLSAHPDPRGIRVGFISKHPFQEMENVLRFDPNGLVSVQGVGGDGDPTEVRRFGRGIVRVRVDPPGISPIHLMTAHLKSKLLTFPGTGSGPNFSTQDEELRAKVAGVALIKRTAEAVSLRVLANNILQTNENHGVVVLGDMNDGIDAATTQILQGPKGSEIGTRGFDMPDQYDRVRLFNMSLQIEKDKRFSRIHKGVGEMLDHIFVSEELLPRADPEPNNKHGKRIRPEVISHLGDDGLDSITDYPSERTSVAGSDHAPVSALFKIKD